MEGVADDLLQIESLTGHVGNLRSVAVGVVL